MKSKRFTLNNEDITKWLKNALTFLAPLALVWLTAIQQGVSFKDSLNLLYMYALNVSIDLLKKFIAGK